MFITVHFPPQHRLSGRKSGCGAEASTQSAACAARNGPGGQSCKYRRHGNLQPFNWAVNRPWPQGLAPPPPLPPLPPASTRWLRLWCPRASGLYVAVVKCFYGFVFTAALPCFPPRPAPPHPAPPPAGPGLSQEQHWNTACAVLRAARGASLRWQPRGEI